jgi:N-methylhydantoinase A
MDDLPMTRIAVEVGGTFTDLIWTDADGHVRTHKVPSTPGDPSDGVIQGLEDAAGKGATGISQLCHGSTVATNAIIERQGCRAMLLVTRGFRDLLVLQRQLRPNVYALACEKPTPVIPLHMTVEVTERIGAAGEIIVPLDDVELLSTVEELIERERPEAVAVCLLHSYRNPDHEKKVHDLLQSRYPELPIVLSSEVLPTFREYERASTTAMAAYLVPLVGRYVARLERHLGTQAASAAFFIMQSSGGVLPSAGARKRGVEMLNSGPAAGVIAAAKLSDMLEDSNIITLDIGGTSADVCLIVNGRPEITSETEVGGLPVGLPSIDIANVGAGGGSLGWIDSGGMLQVGPRSAGARPGPACYGHGGDAPALTDALVKLGWIRPHRFLGGRMTLLPEAADAALQKVASGTGQSLEALSQAMVDIGVAHVSRCIRLVSVQRGHDPKAYTLYGYGGMGPMISALAADELKIRRVVVPPHPGLFSALGLLVADLRRIFRETEIMLLAADAGGLIEETFARMRSSAEDEFASYGYGPDQIAFEYYLEMRYRGQGFELLTLFDSHRLAREGASYLLDLFRRTHHERYGTTPPNSDIEVVTYRLLAQVPGSRHILDRLHEDTAGGDEVAAEDGTIIYQGERVACRFVWRASLPLGYVLEGCSVIEEPTATTLVPPGWRAKVGHAGALVLDRVEGS